MNNFFKRFFTALILAPLFFGSYFLYPQTFPFFLLVILVFVLIFEWPKLIPFDTLKFWIITPFYPVLPVLCLLHLWIEYREINIFIPMYPFFVAWIFDTGSYALGMLIGKHKVCPTISPGKSWEGVFGGFLALSVFNKLFFPTLGLFSIAVVSAILGVVAFCGDIFISYLKRRAKLKDSGNILPGHGGFLDRFDAVFFVAVVFTFYLAIL